MDYRCIRKNYKDNIVVLLYPHTIIIQYNYATPTNI